MKAARPSKHRGSMGHTPAQHHPRYAPAHAPHAPQRHMSGPVPVRPHRPSVHHVPRHHHRAGSPLGELFAILLTMIIIIAILKVL